jgi:nucleotide-binding universal stress UspA family protein
MKNVLVLAHDDIGGEARLQCALDLTRALGGHLTVLDVTRIPVPLEDYFTTAGEMCAFIDEQEREAKNATRLKARMEIEDVSWEWIDATGVISDCIRNQAAFADVIVLSTQSPEGISDMVGIVSNVVEGGELVFAVPPGTSRLAVTGPVVFGWDGSLPAIATLRRAVPLLKLASSVVLVNVDEAGKAHPPEEAARYLARHGVRATVERKPDGIRSPDFHLLDACSEHRAVYCAIGAYGHSRRLQNWFGGVTRRMIENAELPLLLGH